MSEPLSDARLAGMRSAHVQVISNGKPVCDGHYDYEPWPCHAIQLLDEVSRLRAGEDLTPREPDTWPTPGQWIALFNSRTAEERLRIARVVLDNSERAVDCFTLNHAGRLDQMREQIAGLQQQPEQVQP